MSDNLKLNYRQYMNTIALKTKTKVAQIPDSHLMVGVAEDLTPQPVLVYKQYTNQAYNQLTKPLAQLPEEQVDNSLIGTVYTPDDFVSNTFWLGEPTQAGGI